MNTQMIKYIPSYVADVLERHNEEVSQREKELFYAEYGNIESENENLTISVEFLNETNFSGV